MNAADEEISRVFTALPCLGCQHWRSDRIRARIGSVFLAVERGEKVSAPPRDQLLRGCCKIGDPGAITILGGIPVGTVISS